MQVSQIQQQKHNTNFSALKKIKCREVYGQKMPCSWNEKFVIKELKSLANQNEFFKENNVDAEVTVERNWGGRVLLKAKPVVNGLVAKIKNLFVEAEKYEIRANHFCPDDSSFALAKKLRNISNGKEDFYDVFTKI